MLHHNSNASQPGRLLYSSASTASPSNPPQHTASVAGNAFKSNNRPGAASNISFGARMGAGGSLVPQPLHFQQQPWQSLPGALRPASARQQHPRSSLPSHPQPQQNAAHRPPPPRPGSATARVSNAGNSLVRGTSSNTLQPPQLVSSQLGATSRKQMATALPHSSAPAILPPLQSPGCSTQAQHRQLQQQQPSSSASIPPPPFLTPPPHACSPSQLTNQPPSAPLLLRPMSSRGLRISLNPHSPRPTSAAKRVCRAPPSTSQQAPPAQSPLAAPQQQLQLSPSSPLDRHPQPQPRRALPHNLQAATLQLQQAQPPSHHGPLAPLTSPVTTSPSAHNHLAPLSFAPHPGTAASALAAPAALTPPTTLTPAVPASPARVSAAAAPAYRLQHPPPIRHPYFQLLQHRYTDNLHASGTRGQDSSLEQPHTLTRQQQPASASDVNATRGRLVQMDEEDIGSSEDEEIREQVLLSLPSTAARTLQGTGAAAAAAARSVRVAAAGCPTSDSLRQAARPHEPLDPSHSNTQITPQDPQQHSNHPSHPHHDPLNQHKPHQDGHEQRYHDTPDAYLRQDTYHNMGSNGAAPPTSTSPVPVPVAGRDSGRGAGGINGDGGGGGGGGGDVVMAEIHTAGIPNTTTKSQQQLRARQQTQQQQPHPLPQQQQQEQLQESSSSSSNSCKGIAEVPHFAVGLETILGDPFHTDVSSSSHTFRARLGVSHQRLQQNRGLQQQQQRHQPQAHLLPQQQQQDQVYHANAHLLSSAPPARYQGHMVLHPPPEASPSPAPPAAIAAPQHTLPSSFDGAKSVSLCGTSGTEPRQTTHNTIACNDASMFSSLEGSRTSSGGSSAHVLQLQPHPWQPIQHALLHTSGGRTPLPLPSHQASTDEEQPAGKQGRDRSRHRPQPDVDQQQGCQVDRPQHQQGSGAGELEEKEEEECGSCISSGPIGPPTSNLPSERASPRCEGLLRHVHSDNLQEGNAHHLYLDVERVLQSALRQHAMYSNSQQQQQQQQQAEEGASHLPSCSQAWAAGGVGGGPHQPLCRKSSSCNDSSSSSSSSSSGAYQGHHHQQNHYHSQQLQQQCHDQQHQQLQQPHLLHQQQVQDRRPLQQQQQQQQQQRPHYVYSTDVSPLRQLQLRLEAETRASMECLREHGSLLGMLADGSTRVQPVLPCAFSRPSASEGFLGVGDRDGQAERATQAKHTSLGTDPETESWGPCSSSSSSSSHGGASEAGCSRRNSSSASNHRNNDSVVRANCTNSSNGGSMHDLTSHQAPVLNLGPPPEGWQVPDWKLCLQQQEQGTQQQQQQQQEQGTQQQEQGTQQQQQGTQQQQQGTQQQQQEQEQGTQQQQEQGTQQQQQQQQQQEEQEQGTQRQQSVPQQTAMQPGPCQQQDVLQQEVTTQLLPQYAGRDAWDSVNSRVYHTLTHSECQHDRHSQASLAVEESPNSSGSHSHHHRSPLSQLADEARFRRLRALAGQAQHQGYLGPETCEHGGMDLPNLGASTMASASRGSGAASVGDEEGGGAGEELAQNEGGGSSGRVANPLPSMPSLTSTGFSGGRVGYGALNHAYHTSLASLALQTSSHRPRQLSHHQIQRPHNGASSSNTQHSLDDNSNNIPTQNSTSSSSNNNNGSSMLCNLYSNSRSGLGGSHVGGRAGGSTQMCAHTVDSGCRGRGMGSRSSQDTASGDEEGRVHVEDEGSARERIIRSSSSGSGRGSGSGSDDEEGSEDSCEDSSIGGVDSDSKTGSERESDSDSDGQCYAVRVSGARASGGGGGGGCNAHRHAHMRHGGHEHTRRHGSSLSAVAAARRTRGMLDLEQLEQSLEGLRVGLAGLAGLVGSNGGDSHRDAADGVGEGSQEDGEEGAAGSDDLAVHFSGSAHLQLPFQQWMSQHAARLLLPHSMRHMMDLFTPEMLWAFNRSNAHPPEGPEHLGAAHMDNSSPTPISPPHLTNTHGGSARACRAVTRSAQSRRSSGAFDAGVLLSRALSVCGSSRHGSASGCDSRGSSRGMLQDGELHPSVGYGSIQLLLDQWQQQPHQQDALRGPHLPQLQVTEHEGEAMSSPGPGAIDDGHNPVSHDAGGGDARLWDHNAGVAEGGTAPRFRVGAATSASLEANTATSADRGQDPHTAASLGGAANTNTVLSDVHTASSAGLHRDPGTGADLGVSTAGGADMGVPTSAGLGESAATSASVGVCMDRRSGGVDATPQDLIGSSPGGGAGEGICGTPRLLGAAMNLRGVGGCEQRGGGRLCGQQQQQQQGRSPSCAPQRSIFGAKPRRLSRSNLPHPGALRSPTGLLSPPVLMKEYSALDLFCGRFPGKAVREMAGDASFMTSLVSSLSPSLSISTPCIAAVVSGLQGKSVLAGPLGVVSLPPSMPHLDPLVPSPVSVHTSKPPQLPVVSRQQSNHPDRSLGPRAK